MIVCQDSGFYFVHIPKNGGSSVRDQIQPLDDTEGLFLGTKQHPELGYYDSSHVPLVWLKAHFPDWHRVILGLDGYCLVREPHGRFASSLTQRFRQHRHKSPNEVTRAEVVAEIDTVIRELETCGRFPTNTFAHFIRQTEFVFEDDTQLVRNTFRLENIDLLIGELAERLGRPLETGFHSNKSFEFKYKWAERPVSKSKDIVKKVLPAKVVDRLRRVVIAQLAASGETVFQSVLKESGEVRAFVERYYAGDFRLFETVTPRVGAGT